MSAGVIDDAQKTIAWRLEILLVAGYMLAEAEKLADSDRDLHEAVAILKTVKAKKGRKRKNTPEEISELAFQIAY